MTESGFDVALRAFASRRPFQTFIVEMNSGDRLLVRHPEAVSQRGPLLQFVEPNNHSRLFEAASVCQLLDVPADPNSK